MIEDTRDFTGAEAVEIWNSIGCKSAGTTKGKTLTGNRRTRSRIRRTARAVNTRPFLPGLWNIDRPPFGARAPKRALDDVNDVAGSRVKTTPRNRVRISKQIGPERAYDSPRIIGQLLTIIILFLFFFFWKYDCLSPSIFEWKYTNNFNKMINVFFNLF